MKNIGENILNLRKSRQLTQESLASMIGVSTQTVSKWENSTNMPDITLLPIIADIFEVTIDELFGRSDSTESCDPNEVFDITCDDLLRNIIKSGENGEEHSVEELLEHFKSCLDDPRTRTGIFNKNVVYYRKKCGGLLLKKPEKGWRSLLTDDRVSSVLKTLCDEDFRKALDHIIKNHNTDFTIASLCSKCAISDDERLARNFEQSELFNKKQIDIGSETVTVYEMCHGDRLFLIFAILTYAVEFDEYECWYTNYRYNGTYYFD